MYTASDAFFEALWELGITYVFVNLGTDHPSLLEAIVKGQNDHPSTFPQIVTCPNEMVALSMADGYARLTGKPQCVIIHVDVGTQGLGAAVHNASCGRAPVLIFAGLSPYTVEGELRGSRTEYIHWIQDVPDQKQIVSQYCRYAGEIKRGVNVKQMVGRAYQFAVSAPQGPVYLMGSREAMEEEIKPYDIVPQHWGPAALGALPLDAVNKISDALWEAKEPLVITGYSGRNHAAVDALVKLADAVPKLHVIDTGGSDVCFPATHPAYLGLRYGVEPAIKTADVILVVDCDVPWIPTQCRPSPTATIFHVDSDPLKQQIPVFYLPTVARYRADSCSAFVQLEAQISTTRPRPASTAFSARTKAQAERLTGYDTIARAPSQKDAPFTASHLAQVLKEAVPPNTIFAVEAVTATLQIVDQLRPHLPGTWLNCGGGGLGWSGGAALGIKLASLASSSSSSSSTQPPSSPPLIVAIVGDGTFLFSVPTSVFWIARRYNLPVFTIVLNNKGWNAPRRSLLLVHPDGHGSKATKGELAIEFEPSPDYVGVAQAAAGGRAGGRKKTQGKGVVNGGSGVADVERKAPVGEIVPEERSSGTESADEGFVWGGRAETYAQMADLVPKGVAAVVKQGRAAVLEARLDWAQ